MGDYTRSEVRLLLSISSKDARKADELTPAFGVDEVPLIARWHDVQRVKQAVIRGKEAEAKMLALAAIGVHDQRQIAEATGASQATVSRRIRATVDEILAGLGGEAGETDAFSVLPPCRRCGERPRTRVPAVRRRIRGRGMVEVRPERQAAICAECMAEVEEAKAA